MWVLTFGAAWGGQAGLIHACFVDLWVLKQIFTALERNREVQGSSRRLEQRLEQRISGVCVRQEIDDHDDDNKRPTSEGYSDFRRRHTDDDSDHDRDWRRELRPR